MLLEHFLIAEVGTDDSALYFLVLLQRAIAFDLVPQTVVGPALEIVLKQGIGEVPTITAAVGVYQISFKYILPEWNQNGFRKRGNMYRYKTVRVNGKRVPSHRVVWEKANGPIPPGYEIHHVDGDGKNNCLENLVLLTHAEHMALHAKMRREGVDVVDPTNPDVIHSRNKSKRYAITHKEERKAYRERHHDERVAYNAEYYETHKEEVRARHAAYESMHREEHRARAMKWRTEHRELVNARQNLRKAIKRGDPPEKIAIYEKKVREAETLKK